MDPPPTAEFLFPFTPYAIQESFMCNLYKTLEEGKLGIFESPTGTGKSLSLCCGALRWLLDHESKARHDLEKKIEDLKLSTNKTNEDDTDWLSSEFNRIQKNGEINTLRKKLENINNYNKKINDLRERKIEEKKERINRKKWQQKTENKNQLLETDNKHEVKDEIPMDEDLLIDNVVSEMDEEDDADCEVTETAEQNVKIFFCSRTHSQLSQFVNEIKRTQYASEVRVVSLASRQQYCINPSIQKLKNSHLINERCLELQKGKKSKATTKSENGKVTKKSKCSSGCEFYNSSLIEQLRDEAIIEIKDVEDLVTAAKEVRACPYYSARAAVQFAQVVVVPYQTLLHESTRQANGINVKDNIIIIDEAHNLLDTIEHIHSAEISGVQLDTALDKLKHYKEKFSTRFAAKNLLLLNQVIFVVRKILDLLKPQPNTEDEKKVFTLEDFVLTAEIDNYNLRPLIEFCLKAKLAQKLHGFVQRYPIRAPVKEKSQQNNVKHLQSFLTKMAEEKSKKKGKIVVETQPEEIQQVEPEKYISVGNAIQTLISFMETLTSKYTDGRISMSRGKTLRDCYLKFLLLNPAAQFADIVKDARSIILAGGTMQPFSEFRDQLFLSAGAEETRISEFSCGHVIPPENILPICLSSGPSGKRMNFSYEFRNSADTLGEFCRILQNVCNVIPGGIVCFFSSYDYEKTVYNHMQHIGILEKIGVKKKVFREPKTTAEVDQVLEDYSKTIKRSGNNTSSTITGALMLSVVGGKLSEGLNFSDDLGRCVIVVGLPYPNIKSIELQEKMKYLNENVSSTAGNRHYENVCLKAVNQCIGRAVRHANDYATVLLIDERFSRTTVSNALPKWIQRSLVTDAKFGQMFGLIAKFFTARKAKPWH